MLKRCAPIAHSTFWDSIFPAQGRDPARILGLEAKSGPTFLETSGETVRTGHPAYLIARLAHKLPSAQSSPSIDHAFHVSIVDLPEEPYESPASERSARPLSYAVLADLVLLRPLPRSHRRSHRRQPNRVRLYRDLFAVVFIWAIPAYASTATCILCALARDWWCFVSILIGVYAGAFIRVALGMGRFTVASPDCVQHPQEETDEKEEGCNHTHASEGLLLHARGIIVLRGSKSTLVRLTRGRFHIEFSARMDSIQINIGLSALAIQFLMQLVLIPQGTLFGQLMFVASLAVSSMYNVHLAMRQDTLQTQYLLDLCGLNQSSFKQTPMKSKAGMAVFACLALRHQPLYAPRKLLDELVTANGAVWSRWKGLVAGKLETGEPIEFSQEGEVEASLAKLLKDAEDAYRTPGWQRVDQESSDTRESDKVNEE